MTRIQFQWLFSHFAVIFNMKFKMAANGHNEYLYLPECREILWFSYGSAAGYGGYGGCGYDG